MTPSSADRRPLSRDEPARENSRFATTRWSVVLAVADDDAPRARRALAELCEAYWYPLYAYIRRRGYQAAEAGDLTQEFFTRLLEKEYLQAADPQRGRFRAFLLTMLKRFLGHERRRAGALKRGGGRPPLSLDLEAGERRWKAEAVDPLTPEQVYQRRWTLELLQRVLDRLEDDYRAKGKADQFECLRVYITPANPAPSYREVADRLGMSAGAVKVAVHRLRQRYRDLLRDEIADTVADDNEIQDELQFLLDAVRGVS